MAKTMKKQLDSPAERILETASELFYKQGYRATGINEVIKESGVAKATFYHHFPTKDDLCHAYLKGTSAQELAFVESHIRSAHGALNRFLAPMQSLEPWLDKTEYRGCAFLHMVAEIPDHKSPLRKVGRKLYDDIGVLVQRVTDELISSDPKYAHLNASELSKDYMVVFAGAVALAELYQEDWPVRQGINILKNLIGE